MRLRASVVALAVAAAVGAANAAETTELGFVPFVAGDTDIGFGAGFLVGVARLAPGRKPYVWRLESAGFFTFKKREGDGLSAPYQDAFFLLTLPGLLGGRARLELRPSYTRETNQRYYGLGNASRAPDDDLPARDLFTRTHPALWLRGRLALGGGLHAVAGSGYTENRISYDPRSNLARDVASNDPRVRRLLNVDRSHGLHLLELGLAFDRRDDEISTVGGQFHQVSVRVSPGATAHTPYRYVQTNLTARFYVPLAQRLSFATRQVVDVQMGDVPFYELARYQEASAIGGANGVRGVPGDRYHGKVKVFANAELRWLAMRFSVAGSPYALGLVAFADGGRLWADTRPTPFDGDGLGLKYGLGGGLRVHKGETFVVRGDIAWSPDARPIGGYFVAGQMF